MTQAIAKTSMRAVAAGTVPLTATSYGQGVGSLAVAYPNDVLKKRLRRGRGLSAIDRGANNRARSAVLRLQCADDPGRYQAGGVAEVRRQGAAGREAAC